MSENTLLSKSFSYLKELSNYFYEVGFTYDPTLLGIALLVIPLWLGFALWAASKAERAGRSRIGNFLVSLIIPVIYPLFLPWSIRRQNRRKLKQRKTGEASQRQRRIKFGEGNLNNKRRVAAGLELKEGKNEKSDTTGNSPDKGNSSQENKTGDGIKDNKQDEQSEKFKHFFKEQVAAGKDGCTRPIRIVYGDNEVIRNRILETTQQHIIIETGNSEIGSESLRVPLKRISKAEFISDPNQ